MNSVTRFLNFWKLFFSFLPLGLWVAIEMATTINVVIDSLLPFPESKNENETITLQEGRLIK